MKSIPLQCTQNYINLNNIVRISKFQKLFRHALILSTTYFDNYPESCNAYFEKKREGTPEVVFFITRCFDSLL